jgi:TatD DNase family protein
MKLVDVHCHLNHKMFDGKVEDVIARAKEKGVCRIVVSGVNPNGNIDVLELVRKFPDTLRASLGIYPIDAIGLAEDDVTGLPNHRGKINLDAQFKFIKENIKDVVSIGEVGMDFHWATKDETFEEQATNFRKIISFAKEVKLPIVIHSRKAEKECLDILEEEISNSEINVVNHCFSGKKGLVKRAAALGHYFSVPPIVVKSSGFQMLVKIVPIEQLLSETDAPWLSPVKGEPNEPAYVDLTIQEIAKIKEMSYKDVADAIWKNYVKVFGEK